MSDLKAPSRYPRIVDGFDVLARPEMSADEYKTLLQGGYLSCGVTLLSGISDTTPEEIVRKVLVERGPFDLKTTREAFVIFSDIEDTRTLAPRMRGGDALARYIRKNNLGTIIETEPRKNPNSGNRIKVWVWSPPHPSLSTDQRIKHLPVYGKIRRFTAEGDFLGHIPNPGKSELDSVEDTRFQETRGREA